MSVTTFPVTFRSVLGRTILSNGKGHFGPTSRNELTGQSGQP